MRKATSDHPRLVARVQAGGNELRRVALKLPPQLHFAKGGDWRRGAEVSDGGAPGPEPALPHTGRRANARVRDPDGVERIVLRFGHGALKAVKRIAAGKRLRFGLKITDSDGDRTSLKERVRARG